KLRTGAELGKRPQEPFGAHIDCTRELVQCIRRRLLLTVSPLADRAGRYLRDRGKLHLRNPASVENLGQTLGTKSAYTAFHDCGSCCLLTATLRRTRAWSSCSTGWA